MRTFIVFVLLLASMYLQAQQTPLINIYRHNWALLNAAAFPRNYLEDQGLQTHIGLVARTQTIFTEGFPQHYQLRFEHIPDLGNATDMKFGGFLSKDQAGAWSENRIQFNYAYAFSIERNQYFSIGGTLGFIQQRIQADRVNWQTTPNLPANLNSRWLMDVNMGVFYYHRPNLNLRSHSSKYRTSDNQPSFYTGISMSQIISTPLDEQVGNTFITNLKPHYYAVAGGVFNGFEPTVWLRYLPGAEYSTWGFSNPMSMDINLRKMIRQSKGYGKDQKPWLWIGAGLSTNGTANAEIDFRFTLSESNTGVKKVQELQVMVAIGNLRLSKLAFGGGPNLELSGSYTF